MTHTQIVEIQYDCFKGICWMAENNPRLSRKLRSVCGKGQIPYALVLYEHEVLQLEPHTVTSLVDRAKFLRSVVDRKLIISSFPELDVFRAKLAFLGAAFLLEAHAKHYKRQLNLSMKPRNTA